MNYIIYFLITIAILVFVHEFGHFIAAKISKMRVDVFAIGFGKRLLGWNKLSGFSFGDLPDDFDGQGNTDYRVCLLPFGGYVKIAGMVDESFDVKFADKAPEPYEFRSRPTHQKLFVITAGVLMNLLLAYFVFAGINYFQPKQFAKTTTIGYVVPGTQAAKVGFEKNDKILSVDGQNVSYWEDAETKIYIDNIVRNIKVKVARNGKDLTLNIPRKTVSQDISKERPLLPAGFKVSIDSVIKNLPAQKAGIKKGDLLLSIGNEPVESHGQTTTLLSENKEKTLPLTVLREQDTVKLSVTPGKDGKIGVMLNEQFTGPVEFRTMGLGEAMWSGVTDIGRITSMTFTMLSNVVRGKVEFSSAFGGPVKIAQFAAKSADNGLISFIFFLGMLSLSLAILNILPFPVLDGGHFVIILIEGVMKREIPVKVKLAIQNVGFVILLLFMAFAIYNDILSL